MRTIICDIDGTLANIQHRRHFVASKPKNWRAFNASMHLDTLNEDVAWLVRSLWLYDSPRDPWVVTAGGRNQGFIAKERVEVEKIKVVLASGRGEESRKVTTDWLLSHYIYPECTDPNYQFPEYPLFTYEKLYMRAEKDNRSDVIVKQEILEQMRRDGFDPFMALDDRDGVVAMWRSNGLRCLQVDAGSF